MQDNFLALETPLVERLKAQLADLSPKVHVLTTNDVAGVEESKQLTPAVQVTYLGYDIQSIPPMDASAVRITQHWLIWVCVPAHAPALHFITPPLTLTAFWRRWAA